MNYFVNDWLYRPSGSVALDSYVGTDGTVWAAAENPNGAIQTVSSAGVYANGYSVLAEMASLYYATTLPPSPNVSVFCEFTSSFFGLPPIGVRNNQGIAVCVNPSDRSFYCLLLQMNPDAGAFGTTGGYLLRKYTSHAPGEWYDAHYQDLAYLPDPQMYAFTQGQTRQAVLSVTQTRDSYTGALTAVTVTGHVQGVGTLSYTDRSGPLSGPFVGLFATQSGPLALPTHFAASVGAAPTEMGPLLAAASADRQSAYSFEVRDDQGNSLYESTGQHLPNSQGGGGTTYPVSADLQLVSADLSFSDELKAGQATLVFTNPGGDLDRYAYGGYSDLFAPNRTVYVRKGLVTSENPRTGVVTVPAFFGQVVSARLRYRRGEAQTLEVQLQGPLKNLLRQKVTTDRYQNWQANLVFAEVASRYGGLAASRVLPAPLDWTFTDVEFPDYPVGDALQTLMDPALYGVRETYDGMLSTYPRLGTSATGSANLTGWPDGSPPSDLLVRATLPDGALLEEVEAEWQDYEFVNQVRVLGKELTETATLAPQQTLYGQSDSSVAAGDSVVFPITYAQTSNSANTLLAKNVSVVFTVSTDKNLDTLPRTSGTFDVTLSAVGFHDIVNSDGHTVGTVQILSLTDTGVTVRVAGYQYSSGGGLFDPVVRHHGGFDYRFTVVGQPVVVSNQALTVIVDYQPVTVTAEVPTDIFSDGTTFQLSHAPVAMGTPVSVTLNGTTETVNFDGSAVSQRFSVDWERGRIVLTTPTAHGFAADSHGTGQEGAVSTGSAIDASYVLSPAPAAVYQTSAIGADMTYLLPGLTPGQGYTVRLHFAETQDDRAGLRLFDVYVQGAKVGTALDVFALAGAKNRAYVWEYSGASPNLDGTLAVEVRQARDDSLHVLKQTNADGTQSTLDVEHPLLAGLEVRGQAGSGPQPYAINVGGGAVGGAAQSLSAVSYAYSPNQQVYGVQSQEVNNPLLRTAAQCLAVGTYYLNYAGWARNTLTIRVASQPAVYCGDCVKFYNPRTNTDNWMYVQSIRRSWSRPDPGSGDDSTLPDADVFTGFLLCSRVRTPS